MASRLSTLITRRPFHGHGHLVASLFVSSDLFLIEFSRAQSEPLANDLTQQDDDRLRVYRRLDLAWYQWLYGQMQRAQQKTAAGDIAQDVYSVMRQRFMPVWYWMRFTYTLNQMHYAETHHGDARYRPPVPMRTAPHAGTITTRS